MILTSLKRLLRLFTGYCLGHWLTLSGAVSKRLCAIDEQGLVAIVCCHNPSPSRFRKIVKWLKSRGFNFISQESVLDAIGRGAPLPSRSVWMTFDDGWKGNCKLIPIIEEHNIPITVFLATEAVETGTTIWPTIVRANAEILPHTGAEAMKKMANRERQDILDGVLRHPKARIPNEMMTPHDVRALADHPLISFGNHTHGHVIACQCEQEELEDEIHEAARRIRKWTDQETELFCYPNGDWNAQTQDVLDRNGVKAALLVTFSLWDPRTDQDPLRLPRVVLYDDVTYRENICRVLGIWPTQSRCPFENT